MKKSLSEKKNHFRKIFSGLRLTLGDEDVSKKSSQISQKILEIDGVKDAEKILAYIPINKEVETREIIDGLLKMRVNVFVPAFWNNNYVACRFTSWSNLEVGPFEILQPKHFDVLDIGNINVALIPGIAFSKAGFRLGYGEGVYDRLFSKSRVFKIGLAYDFQVIDDLPTEEHDLKMDLVVTEKRIVKIT